MNFTFAYPWVLFGLLAIPVLAVLRFWPRLRKRREGTFVLSRASGFLSQTRGIRQYLRPACDALLLAALALLLVAMARPQSVQGDDIEVEGIDIYLTLDMSGSMRAIDADKQKVAELKRMGKRPTNRFEEAVGTLKQFIESREHDRIGMVVFAREAFLQFPLTLDYNTILRMLDRLELGDIDEGGTAIGNALGRAVAGLKDSDAETKIVILITDGDRRGGNISPMEAADIAQKSDIKVFPILVGRDGPTLVPVQMPGFLGQGNRIRYRQRKFPVDPELLQNIAETTGGEYYSTTAGEGLKQRIHQILDKFERTRLNSSSDVNRAELFQPFVLWAIVLIALQFMLRQTILRSFP